MASIASIAEVAALIGDPARASMMQALMDGRALTAGELAAFAGVTPQTASGHLGQLTSAGLLSVQQQGRHRYHKLASPQVAQLLESLMLVATGTLKPRTRTGPRDEAMRLARTCYDHIAGRLGVAMADAMERHGYIDVDDDAASISPEGERFLITLNMGFDSSAAKLPMPGLPEKRILPLCKLCLDWSERRPHLAGKLGAALCSHFLDTGWIRRRSASRALDITPTGQHAFRSLLGIELV
ncbi:MAG: ArsR/SmtB family transcription factor [Beijerinckiaceae bacterium]